MATSRFFVANLASSVNEQDLTKLFQDYGEVVRVELKSKENTVDPSNVKIIAFVTLNIDASDAQYCVNQLNWHKLKGVQIEISLAKESFLERLKREREEATAAAASTISTEVATKVFETQHLQNTRKKFADNVDIESDDDDISGLLITKKRAATSLHNGKIVIQSYDTTPLHVIETKKSVRHLDAKASSADQKRKESLNKMKNDYQQKKISIQQALANLDAPIAKKIKFSDTGDSENDNNSASVGVATTSENHAESGSGGKLFDSDDEENVDEDAMVGFDLKPEMLGKKGARLLEMRSKQQTLDPRFKLNAKFVDDVDGEEDDQDENEDDLHAVTAVNADQERDWQMGILEQVVGTKLDTGSIAQKAAKNKQMLRFDPSKDEHQKFLRTKAKDVEETQSFSGKTKKQTKASENKTDGEAQEHATDEAAEVSKEVFYMVTDSLAQSLKTRGDGFSLLNMFGRSGDEVLERKDQLKKVSNEKILVNPLSASTLKPFSYDSSSTESEGEESAIATQTGAVAKVPKVEKQKGKVKIAMETFFIPKNDVRLKEGSNFFKYANRNKANVDYEVVRNRLKQLIKTKITKTKKLQARR